MRQFSIENYDAFDAALDRARARLAAEATGGTPSFPADILAKRPQLIQAQQDAYNARKEELDSTINVMRNTAAQREQEAAARVLAYKDAQRVPGGRRVAMAVNYRRAHGLGPRTARETVTV